MCVALPLAHVCTYTVHTHTAHTLAFKSAPKFFVPAPHHLSHSHSAILLRLPSLSCTRPVVNRFAAFQHTAAAAAAIAALGYMNYVYLPNVFYIDILQNIIFFRGAAAAAAAVATATTAIARMRVCVRVFFLSYPACVCVLFISSAHLYLEMRRKKERIYTLNRTERVYNVHSRFLCTYSQKNCEKSTSERASERLNGGRANEWAGKHRQPASKASVVVNSRSLRCRCRCRPSSSSYRSELESPNIYCFSFFSWLGKV